jgi:hypothetical protein
MVPADSAGELVLLKTAQEEKSSDGGTAGKLSRYARG